MDTFTNKVQKVYAIRFGNHVEFRASIKPLKTRVSRWKTTKVKMQPDFSGNNYYYGRYKLVEVPVTLIQKTFEGGRILGYMKASTVLVRMGLKVPDNKLVEVPEPIASDLLRPSWRKANLTWQ